MNMSMSMREKLARAMHGFRQSRGFSGNAAWEYEPAAIQELYLGTADAVLDALLEPDEGMVEAGEGSLSSLDYRCECDAKNIFRAMITAARSGG